MFVGRSSLLELIDQMVVTSGKEPKPVVVVEGCGGSGRTRLLEKVEEKWHGRTPAVLVRPLEFAGDDTTAVRPVLAAVMLGLSLGAPGYEVAFPRVVLAHVAMEWNNPEINPGRTLADLLTHINKYPDRAVLLRLVQAIAQAAGTLASNIKVPGVAAIAPPLAKQIADEIVGRLQRSHAVAKSSWSRPVWDWFRHQGQGLDRNPERELLRLSNQSRSSDDTIRRAVDELLVAALLADLRYSLANTTNRPANVLVLLDDGDAPTARSFTRSLLRVRQAIAETPGNPERDIPDPLTVVVSSAGPLAEELTRDHRASEQWVEAALDGAAPASGSWLRVSSSSLTAGNVRQLAKDYDWPDHVSPDAIAAPVFRLTRGHPLSTEVLLKRLQDELRVADTVDIDGLLRRPGSLVEELLIPFVRALDAHKVVDKTLLPALITLSAARNRLEAATLRDLLPAPVGLDSPLFTAPSLWSRENQRLDPVVRYLGLRALAARPQNDEASWTVVFEALRANADDDIGRLHHDRMLGRRTEVAAELAAALREMPSAEWLAVFDAVTETPDPRERDIDTIRGHGQPATVIGHTARLLGVIPALEKDPCVTSAADIKTLRGHANHSYVQLASADGVTDPFLFIERALSYRD